MDDVTSQPGRLCERAGLRARPVLLGVLAVTLCACDEVRSWPEFGFEAEYAPPCPDAEADCHTVHGCSSTSVPWMEGPHDGFDALDPRELARESLRWFEESPEAATWRVDPSPHLVLEYPSRGRRVTARFDAGAGLSWEEQLRTWFAASPPEGDGTGPFAAEFYGWDVYFGVQGTVSGSTASDHEAVREMKALLASLPPSPLFEHPTVSLSYNVRRSSHEMDSYGSDFVRTEQLDELPERVRAKFAKYAFMRD